MTEGILTGVKARSAGIFTLQVCSSTEVSTMYQRILVPVDGSPTSILGLAEAIELAKLTGASLRLVHVLDRPAFVDDEIYAAVDVFAVLREAGERLLQQTASRVAAAGVDVSVFLSGVLPGRVCDVVMEQAKAFDADLIVLGSHGRRGLGRLLIGSDAEQIVRIATVPVLLVRSSPGVSPAAATGVATAAAAAAATVPA